MIGDGHFIDSSKLLNKLINGISPPHPTHNLEVSIKGSHNYPSGKIMNLQRSQVYLGSSMATGDNDG